MFDVWCLAFGVWCLVFCVLCLVFDVKSLQHQVEGFGTSDLGIRKAHLRPEVPPVSGFWFRA